MKRINIFSVMFLLVMVACSTAPASVTERPATFLTSILLTASQASAPTADATHMQEPISLFLSFPRVNCCKARTVEAGEYEIPSWFSVPLKMDVGQGWGVMNEEAARLFLLAGKGRNEFNDPSQVLVVTSIPNGDAHQVLTSIRNAPELTPIGEIVETTIAGLSGWQFDATANPNPANKGSRAEGIPPESPTLPAIGQYFTPGFLWTTWTAQPRMRFIALNAGEHVLLFVIESPPAEFDSFAAEAHRVLQSLKLRK